MLLDSLTKVCSNIFSRNSAFVWNLGSLTSLFIVKLWTTIILILSKTYQMKGEEGNRIMPWSMTVCFPLMDCIADVRDLRDIWKSLNNCLPNRWSCAYPSTKCSTDTNASAYSFLYSLARWIKASKSLPNIEPAVSPMTCQTVAKSDY